MDIIDECIIEKADDGLLHLIEKAKIAALSKEEYAEYEASLKALSDDGLAEDFGYRRGKVEGRIEGRAEGEAEGKAEEKAELVKRMIRKRFNLELVAEISGLSIDEIMKIKVLSEL